jgi:hypothetical protein
VQQVRKHFFSEIHHHQQPPCSAACDCTSASELPVFFSKFAANLSGVTISHALLQKSCLLCAEIRQLLMRSLCHAQSSSSAAPSNSSLAIFGTNLRSIACSVSHLLLKVLSQADESIYYSHSAASVVQQLLLLSQLLQTCLELPAVASSYAAHVTFIVPRLLENSVPPHMIPSLSLPQCFADALFQRCQHTLKR